MPIKLNGSSSAFAKGAMVYSKYSTGCIRNILLKSHGVREELKQSTQGLGLQNEDAYGAKLVSDGRTILARELPIVGESAIASDAIFSGRFDYQVATPLGPQIVELKSTQSKNKLAELKKGVYTVENLAQTVAYVVETGSTGGAQLVYTHYKYDAQNVYQPTYERSFDISFSASGSILVDGVASGFFVRDLYAHQALVYVHLSENRVGPRPYNYESQWASPCTYCPFKKACQGYDENPLSTTESFINQAKECLTNGSAT